VTVVLSLEWNRFVQILDKLFSAIFFEFSFFSQSAVESESNLAYRQSKTAVFFLFRHNGAKYQNVGYRPAVDINIHSNTTLIHNAAILEDMSQSMF
jgi:hypothetical protein